MIAAAPDVQQTRCLRYRYRYSECRRCADACPHDAVAASDEGVALDAGKCRNCALCTTACPTAALLPANLTRIELLKQAIKVKRFAIACVPSAADGDLAVPCLGAVDATILAYLGKRGVEVALLGATHCSRCEHGGKGAAAIVANVAARDVLAEASLEESWAALTVVESPDAPSPTVDDYRSERRHLFRRLFGKGVDETVKAVALPPIAPAIVDKAIRPGPWHVPEMRELLQITARRADAMPCRVPSLPALPVADMRLATGCTQCEACIRACPSGALQIREGEADWTFLFLPDRCTGCGLCVEVCQPRVLRASEMVDLTPGGTGKPLDIRAKQRCNRCDRFFVSPEPQETCAVCCDDDEAFGQIFG